MRILVTGHKGYVGTSLVPMLLSEGYRIVGVDSDLFEACSLFSPDWTIPSIKKDIRDIETTDLEGIDAIIHLAALSNDPLSDLDPKITYEVNHRASVRLAGLAKKTGVGRFLFSSSCSIYGASGDSLKTETSKPNPITPYAGSKLLAERDISKLSNSKFTPVILRGATLYGISPSLRFDLVLNNLMAWAYCSSVILMKSDGKAWRPLVHVEDFARAFIAILKTPTDIIHNEVFNIGITEENYQVKSLAEIVKEVVPNSYIQCIEDVETDRRSYRVDFSKLHKIIPEFEPQWNVRLGAHQLYETYKEIEFTKEEFEEKYGRVEHIERMVRNGQLDRTLRWKETGKE